jgi:Tol biopolymer transport system component
LDSAEKWPVVSASSNAVYADHYLLYVRDNALVAQRFDARRYVLSGEPHTVSDAVQYLPIIDLAVFDVAGKRTLVAQTGTGAARSQLMWFDRNGKPSGAVGTPGIFGNLSLSPDGRRVVVDQTDSDGRHVNIWIYELANAAATRLTFSLAADQLPTWSPDGKHVVFGSNQKLRFVLYEKNSDGSGSSQEIADLGAEEVGAWNWSRDGKYLLVMKNKDLWYLPLSDRQPRPLVETSGSIRNAQFSPDGRFVAYSSNETGNWEVYVSPFPSGNSKWQISRGGGEEPRWSGNGKELFYLSGEGKMMLYRLA